MKILILKPSSLGDVIQAMPVLRLLKKRFPQSEIYWWIDAGLVELFRDDPDLAGVILFQRKRWASPRHWDEMLRSIFHLRSMRFDLVIDLQGLLRSAAFAWLANGTFTIGVDDPREGAGSFYDQTVPRPSFHTHAVDWYLEVLRRLHVPVNEDFDWMPENATIQSIVRRKWDTDASPWMVLNPGARWMNKLWPGEHYVELIRLLAKGYPNHRFAVLGDKSSSPLASQMATASSRCLDLTGKTSLREMVAWIRLSDLMITNDTGPMHVGAALGKPVVAMFGPTEARRTGAYGQVEHALRIPLPCAPCLKSTCSYGKPIECLRGISPLRVYAEVTRRLPGKVLLASTQAELATV